MMLDNRIRGGGPAITNSKEKREGDREAVQMGNNEWL